MASWDDNKAQDNPPWMSDRLDQRLPIFAALDNNITVTTAWLDSHDVKTASEKAGRISTHFCFIRFESKLQLIVTASKCDITNNFQSIILP